MNAVERVKQICKERGIPLAKLERECNFSNGYIGQLRKGTIPGDRLKVISEYLGVTMDYLLGETSDQWYIDEETAKVAQEILSDPDRRALFEASAGCRPEYLRIASEMLLKLKETNPNG